MLLLYVQKLLALSCLKLRVCKLWAMIFGSSKLIAWGYCLTCQQTQCSNKKRQFSADISDVLFLSSTFNTHHRLKVSSNWHNAALNWHIVQLSAMFTSHQTKDTPIHNPLHRSYPLAHHSPLFIRRPAIPSTYTNHYHHVSTAISN